MEIYRYLKKNDINENEKREKRLSYYNLFYKDENLLLCNNIVDFRDEFELYSGSDLYYYNASSGEEATEEEYNEDESGEITCESKEIYQYYLIDYSTASRLASYTNEIIFYLERLDVYILGVTHYGTSWNYVSTEIKLKEDSKGDYIAYIERGESNE